MMRVTVGGSFMVRSASAYWLSPFSCANSCKITHWSTVTPALACFKARCACFFISLLVRSSKKPVNGGGGFFMLAGTFSSCTNYSQRYNFIFIWKLFFEN